MNKIFDKNYFRTDNNKVKVIIDTDPGVDDIACLVYAMNDENIDLKLITTVAGNVSVEKATRNTLHALDLFEEQYPVAVGEKKALVRTSPTAEFIHSKEGMGAYIPPNTTISKPIDEHAVCAMKRVISGGNGDVVPVMLGPLTNLGKLLLDYPEIKNKIPKVVIMGGAPFGNTNYPEHVSFNLSTDPEAFQILLDSKIPILMCPSHMGRIKAHLEADFVNSLKEKGEVGKFLFDMYQGYWEPKYIPKRITTNDSCALFALVYPKIFSIKKASVKVNVTDAPGRTYIDFTKEGRIEFIDDLNKPAFLSLLLSELEEMKDKKLRF